MSDAATLANEARCFDACIPAGMAWAVMAFILEQSIDGVAVSADPETLANDARCYDCNGTTLGMVIKALVDLNASIIAGGGGGASPCFTCSSTGMPLVPPDPAKCTCAITFGIGDWVGFFWVWDNGFTNTWVQVPGGP